MGHRNDLDAITALDVGVMRIAGVWSIYFCNVLLARIDERDYVLRA